MKKVLVTLLVLGLVLSASGMVFASKVVIENEDGYPVVRYKEENKGGQEKFTQSNEQFTMFTGKDTLGVTGIHKKLPGVILGGALISNSSKEGNDFELIGGKQFLSKTNSKLTYDVSLAIRNTGDVSIIANTKYDFFRGFAISAGVHSSEGLLLGLTMKYD